MDQEKQFKSIYAQISEAFKLRVEYSIHYIAYDMELTQEEKDNSTYQLQYNGEYTPLMLRMNWTDPLLNSLRKILQECFVMNYVEPDHQKDFIKNVIQKPIKALEALKSIVELIKNLEPNSNVYQEIEKRFYHHSTVFQIYNVVLYRLDKEEEFVKLLGFLNEHIYLVNEIIDLLKLYEITENYWDKIKPPNKKDLYKSDLKRDQIILLFHFLRENGLIHKQTSATSMGVAIEFCTGYSHNQIRKLFADPADNNPKDDLECNSEDVDNVIAKLDETKESLEKYKKDFGI